MKIKYKHYGNDCILYDQVICEDNIVVTINWVEGWGSNKPESKVTVCEDEDQAINIFNTICNKLKHKKYELEYRR